MLTTQVLFSFLFYQYRKYNFSNEFYDCRHCCHCYYERDMCPDFLPLLSYRTPAPPVLLPPLPANLQRVSLPPSLPSSHLEAMFWKAMVLNSFSQYLNLPEHFFSAFKLRVNALIPKSFSWAFVLYFT